LALISVIPKDATFWVWITLWQI